MLKYDNTSAVCRVFTFKEGLLSSVAHDLEIDVSRFVVEIDPERGTLSATFDARSLRVVAALVEGRPRSTLLSTADRSKIDRQIVSDVLAAARHPTVTFKSRRMTARPDGGYAIEGDLTLAGITRSLAVATCLDEGHQVAEVELHQPDFGIKPFKAMLGALKVQANVKVRVTIPSH